MLFLLLDVCLVLWERWSLHIKTLISPSGGENQECPVVLRSHVSDKTPKEGTAAGLWQGWGWESRSSDPGLCLYHWWAGDPSQTPGTFHVSFLSVFLFPSRPQSLSQVSSWSAFPASFREPWGGPPAVRSIFVKCRSSLASLLTLLMWIHHPGSQALYSLVSLLPCQPHTGQPYTS